MKARKFGYDVACERRPSDNPLRVSRCQMPGHFGGKAYGHLRLVKQRQLKSQQDENGKRKMFFVSALSKVLSVDSLSCPPIWKIEKDREKEKVRLQASEAQREKELDELKKKKTNKETFFVGGTT